jgi:hypothetical protein
VLVEAARLLDLHEAVADRLHLEVLTGHLVVLLHESGYALHVLRADLLQLLP